MIRMLVNIAFPETQDCIAACGHVGILGSIEFHSVGLSLVWLRKLIGMAVPIFTIELDYYTARRHECINAELIANEVLCQVFNPKIVKNLIASKFKFIRADFLLHCAHVDELLAPVWISSAALQRAVSCIGAGRRSKKHLITDFADAGSLVSALPFIQALKGAKARLFHAIGRYIVGLTTLLADFILAVHALRTFVCTVAIQGAVVLLWPCSLSNSAAAPRACKCPDLVFTFSHNQNIPQLRSIVKPMELICY